MRMVARYATRSEAMERAAFLQDNGIATHISDMTSMRPNLAHQGQFRAGLWVVLESQYEDALALLENPGHVVQTALGAEQLDALETEGAAQARATLLRWLIVVAVGLGAVAWWVAQLDGG